jgi:two-component system copper resistance phosphate regulon response regulator CusR
VPAIEWAGGSGFISNDALSTFDDAHSGVSRTKETAAFLAKGLSEAGFVADFARGGKTGLKHARAIRFDLLIVDVMLPNKDGWEVVAELRRDGIRTPILFLTARDGVRDRVKGLELGADDWSCDKMPPRV